MVSHICLLVELGPICNSVAASLCLKSCEDHSLLKSYNGGLWKNGRFAFAHYLQLAMIFLAHFLRFQLLNFFTTQSRSISD